MKIGIVTVYNSPNCGSFLQAISLKHFFEENGHSVVFIRNHTALKNRLPYRFSLAAKRLLQGQWRIAKRILVSWWSFVWAQRAFNVVSQNCKDVEVYVLGSDTIWNIEEQFFQDNYRLFFGESFSSYKIAYAPSIGDTKIEKLLDNKPIIESIKNIDYVSARDLNTVEFLKKIHSSEIAYVVDPTLLSDVNYYNSISQPCEEPPFLLYYYFGSIDPIVKEKITEYTKAHGLKIISFGENISNCDEYIPFDPLKMLSYFREAHTIVTNTFHGNVFSIIYNKNFVNIESGKSKVSDLLKRYDLSGRTVKSNDNVEKILNEIIDYDSVNIKIAKDKNNSKSFLNNSLFECTE